MVASRKQKLNESNDQSCFSFYYISDTNVDEVLSFSDPTMIPSSFLTEIQQDDIYSTILEELQKRFAIHLQPKLDDEQQQQQQPDKIFSPHLFALQDDGDDDNEDEDDRLSLGDDIISTVSSEPHDLPVEEEDYDTDIEPGKIFIDVIVFHLS